MVELVCERGLCVGSVEVSGHVHGSVGGLVESRELRVQQIERRSEVVERRRNEPEKLELEPFVPDRLRRDFGLDVTLHFRNERIASEHDPRHGVESGERSRLGHVLEHLRDSTVLACVTSCRDGRPVRRGVRNVREGPRTGVIADRDREDSRALRRRARAAAETSYAHTHDAWDPAEHPAPNVAPHPASPPLPLSRRIAAIACA